MNGWPHANRLNIGKTIRRSGVVCVCVHWNQFHLPFKLKLCKIIECSAKEHLLEAKDICPITFANAKHCLPCHLKCQPNYMFTMNEREPKRRLNNLFDLHLFFLLLFVDKFQCRVRVIMFDKIHCEMVWMRIIHALMVSTIVCCFRARL